MSTINATTYANAAGTGPCSVTGHGMPATRTIYDQTTPAITRSDNVSSVTDQAAGNFAVNFTTNYAAAGKVIAAVCRSVTPGSVAGNINVDAQTTSADDFLAVDQSSTPTDIVQNCTAHTGDLA